MSVRFVNLSYILDFQNKFGMLNDRTMAVKNIHIEQHKLIMLTSNLRSVLSVRGLTLWVRIPLVPCLRQTQRIAMAPSNTQPIEVKVAGLPVES